MAGQAGHQGPHRDRATRRSSAPRPGSIGASRRLSRCSVRRRSPSASRAHFPDDRPPARLQPPAPRAGRAGRAPDRRQSGTSRSWTGTWTIIDREPTSRDRRPFLRDRLCEHEPMPQTIFIREGCARAVPRPPDRPARRSRGASSILFAEAAKRSGLRRPGGRPLRGELRSFGRLCDAFGIVGVSKLGRMIRTFRRMGSGADRDGRQGRPKNVMYTPFRMVQLDAGPAG